MKIVVSDPKSGRSKGMEVNADVATTLVARKIGDVIEGSAFGMSGYKLKISGGSDTSGFPLDRSIQGTGKVRTLRLISSSGQQKGQYRRETVRGGIIAADTAQVNLSISEYGDKAIDEIIPPKVKKEEPKTEEAKK